jgi:membrane-bound lytic murein transglycosylase MltF
MALNERLSKAGKKPVNLTFVPDALEDEDMMEMLNAGLLQAIVVDDFKAKTWKQVLPKIKVREDIRLREPTRKGWAIRKESPQLAAVLTEFYQTWVKKEGVVPYRMKQYMTTIKQLNNPANSADYKRFQETVALFRKYGDKYHFDPLMLAAQGYQESTLDQNVKSPVGAIGVMQIMPATGKELNVGDIHAIEPNIHGGTKYMDQLMTRYFQDAKFDDQNRTLFAFASYNCGPGNVAKMRKLAEQRGLDPDRWFNNVEIITAEKIGMETTTYVRNIFKYYVSYKLVEDAKANAERLKSGVAPVSK